MRVGYLSDGGEIDVRRKRTALAEELTKAQKGDGIPLVFQPGFLDSTDRRTAISRELRRRYERLKADAGVNSFQKEMLAQRAIFVAVQLESLEVRATETGATVDVGVYTQGINCLVGLLRALGLEPAQAAE